MGNEDKYKDREKNLESESVKADEVVKITISKDAEAGLLRFLEKVNDGFDAGRINRQQVASWIIRQVADTWDSEQIKQIRQEHFDEFALLEAILRKGKETGTLPTDLRSLLRAHVGEVAKRPPRKSQTGSSTKGLTSNYTNDVTCTDAARCPTSPEEGKADE